VQNNDQQEQNNNLKLNLSVDKTIDNDKQQTAQLQQAQQPVDATTILNLTSLPSIKRMEQESFKPEFIEELPKEEKESKDLASSESTVILINSMNNSRMLNSQKISQLVNNASTVASNQQVNDEQTNRPKTNQTNDGDIMKFEDELDVQPHSFSIASRLNMNSSKLESALIKDDLSTSTTSSTTTGEPDEETQTGKKLKKKHHLHIFQLKKKHKNNPERFKTIKIRAPRLHLSNNSSKPFSDKQVRRHKIGYASLVRTRNVNLTDYHSDDGLFIKVSALNALERTLLTLNIIYD
jgi:hypothetical protein